jgi:VWFA-related protein
LIDHRGILVQVRCAFLFATMGMFALAICARACPLPNPQEALQTTADLVKVDVSVADRRGNFLAGLRQEDFRILDNGKEQATAFFLPVETPAEILVMIETGPAVYLIRSEHLAAAYTLMNGLDPSDRVALVAYDQAPRQILAFTSDKSAWLSSLGEIQYNIGMGDLNLYGSLSQVLDWLNPIRGKTALVLLTTGLDSSQPSRRDALVQKLRRVDIAIFAVALGGALRSSTKAKLPNKKDISANNLNTKVVSPVPENTVSFAQADQDLRGLAATTGGNAYFPSSREDFLSIYRKIAAALRHQYVLGFVPSHDGQYHSLAVQLVARSGQSTKPGSRKPEYQVSARTGYLAPGP